jgi:polysaccharide export outer membrane protein
LHALLVDGDLSQNITLASGDSIVVPSAAAEKAYVFGAVGKPGAADFNSGSLSLLGALSDAGMDLKDYTDARLTQVRVIRAHGASAQFFVIDATRIMAGQAASFDLLPGDIVFVPPTLVATWNEVLQQLIPSLQTASLALQPFVSIRYLEITH